MKPVFDTIYDTLTPASQIELAAKKQQFETLISFIRDRNKLKVVDVADNKKLMNILASFSQTEFKEMSPVLITDIKQAAAAANSYQQAAGKRKKTYKHSSTKKSKSRRNKMRK